MPLNSRSGGWSLSALQGGQFFARGSCSERSLNEVAKVVEVWWSTCQCIGPEVICIPGRCQISVTLPLSALNPWQPQTSERFVNSWVTLMTTREDIGETGFQQSWWREKFGEIFKMDQKCSKRFKKTRRFEKTGNQKRGASGSFEHLCGKKQIKYYWHCISSQRKPFPKLPETLG